MILFVLEEEQGISGDQRSFRHVKAVVAQASLTDPRTPSPVVAQMAGEDEDSKSMVSGLTRVDYTTGNPRTDPDTGEVMRRDARVREVAETAPEGADASGTQEPAVTVSGTPDTKEAVSGGQATSSGEKPSGEPSSGSGKNPQVKRMPKRPAAKLMPRKRIVKVKQEPGSTAKVPGKNRFKNQETKRRQKAKWEEIQKTAREERAQPAPVFEIPARGGEAPVRSFFDPMSGRRETMEVTPIQKDQKFRAGQSGFSRYPTETRTCYQCGEKGHLSANCPRRTRRVSLTQGTIEFVGPEETRPRVRLQGNMGSVPSASGEGPGTDEIGPEDSASQIGGAFLGTMSVIGGVAGKKALPVPPPPPPPQGSPRKVRSRPGLPPTGLPPSSVRPTLPPKFSQDGPQEGRLTEEALKSRSERPKTLPKRPTTPPKKAAAKPATPKKRTSEEAENPEGPAQPRGSVGKAVRPIPRTPSPKRAVEEMARNDAAARGSAPSRALWPAEEKALKDAAAKAKPAAKAPAATVDLVTPVTDNAGHGEAHLVAAQGSGRLSALTVHQQTPMSSQAPTPTSPAGDSMVAGEGPGPSVHHWSQAPVIAPLPSTPPPAPVGGETEVCVACQGSGLLNSQVNLRLFRLIGTGQLRLGQTPQAAPTTPAPAAPAAPAATATPAGPGNGTEVSPSLSENSGRSRTPAHSGVCHVSEDGSMTMFDSGGNVLILELACGVDSVIQNASREFGCNYIGIHAGLELSSTQRQAYKFFKSFAEGSSGSADSQKLIQVHISLPCTGGSPLLDLSKKDRTPAQDAYFRLLDHCKRYISYIKGMGNVGSAVTLELPKSNRFWSDERLKRFLADHGMQKSADCAACAMGLTTSQGQPIGKVFRIACSDQVLASGLAKRFQCRCTQDHAPLNQVNYSMTERYSYKFARFYCRAIALRWIDQQEET